MSQKQVLIPVSSCCDSRDAAAPGIRAEQDRLTDILHAHINLYPGIKQLPRLVAASADRATLKTGPSARIPCRPT